MDFDEASFAIGFAVGGASIGLLIYGTICLYWYCRIMDGVRQSK